MKKTTAQPLPATHNAPQASKDNAASQANSRWVGGIDGIHRGLLYGWALDTANTDARVALEILLNGDTIGCVIADVVRHDLHAVFSQHFTDKHFDSCHGFVADVGETSQQTHNEKSVFTVKIANTDHLLPDTIERLADQKPPLGASSLVFSDGAMRLHGWAIDYQDEKRVLKIHASHDGKLVAEAIANLNHPSTRAMRVEGHGFNLDLPLALADGKQHTIHISDEQGRALNGSPITVCCYAEGLSTLIKPTDESLLAPVLQSYENYLPRSVGLAHYPAWAAQFEAPAKSATKLKANAALKLKQVGVTVVVFDSMEADASAKPSAHFSKAQLDQSLASIAQQNHQNTQLILPHSEGVKNIKRVEFSKQLAEAALSGSEFICCLRYGDTFAPHALSSAIAAFVNDDVAVAYTDSEYQNQAWFKPAWNLDYALATDYPLDFFMLRTAGLQQYLRLNFLQENTLQNALPNNYAEFAWGFFASLVKRVADNSPAAHAYPIVHVPRVLYQRQSAFTEEETSQRLQAALRALQSLEPTSTLEPLTHITSAAPCALRRVQRKLSAQQKKIKVSLIIPTRDYLDLLQACLTSLKKFTHWQNLEIIVIDNGSRESATLAYFKKIETQGIRVLAMPSPFNFADLNNRAVQQATGDIIGLINNDIEALHEGWLDEMLSHLLQTRVGIVGAKLLWPNGMVQHGGVLLGLGNAAGHFGNRLADADLGDHGRNQVVQQVSAVTAACLLMRKADYLAVGGMDAVAFPVAFNDLDLCLKMRQTGKTIIWTPEARLLHAESASRGHEDTPQKKARSQRELANLRERWGSALLRDPNYHPSLNLDAHSQAYNGLAVPPRDRSARTPALAQDVKAVQMVEAMEAAHHPANAIAKTPAGKSTKKSAQPVPQPQTTASGKAATKKNSK